MVASDVKLLGARRSPFANRVQFALDLKSVDYEFLPENLLEKSELLLKSNPVHKKVPVLIHGDKPICESLVILQYINETWPDGPSILPSDPYARATARFWAAYIDDKWFPVVLRWLKEAHLVNEEEKASILDEIAQGLTLMEDTLMKSSGNGKGLFGGETLGYLDIVLGSYLGWLRTAELDTNVKIIDETKTPALAEWADRFTSHPTVKGTLPGPEELINFLKVMQAKKAAEKAAAAAEAASN